MTYFCCMMHCRRLVIYLIPVFLFIPYISLGQHYSKELGGYMVSVSEYRGDTVPSVFLPELPVFPPIKNKKTEKFYWKTVRDVKKVYPYVKIVGQEYSRISSMFDTVTNEKERKKYMKKYEKELLDKYTPIMRTFTLSQGKMMIKLIDRETDMTSYALIKEFRGGFVAWWWQVFAKFVGADLKDEYDVGAKEQDRIIERVIMLYEAGLL